MHFRSPITLPLLTATSLISLAVSAASADTFEVTSPLNDGPGTLRDAIAQADANPGSDTVAFHPLLTGTITLTQTIYVHQPVTLIGTPSVAISGGGNVCPFVLMPGVGDLGMLGLEIRDCICVFAMGGNVRVNFQNCTFRDNGQPGLYAGVFNQAPTNQFKICGVIQSCSFISNIGWFGGVAVAAPPSPGHTLDITNCTFHGNQATSQGGVWTIYTGGATAMGLIRISHSTITGNTGGPNEGNGSGAFHLDWATPGGGTVLQVSNSIIAENTPGLPGVSPNFTGFGGQVSLTGSNVQSNPMLEPLKRVGNAIVRLPLVGSPCIDAAAADASVVTDQLGTIRPFLAPGAVPAPGSHGADIGAIEFVPTPCAADFDRSGTVAVPDIFAFLTAWFAGCP